VPRPSGNRSGRPTGRLSSMSRATASTSSLPWVEFPGWSGPESTPAPAAASATSPPSRGLRMESAFYSTGPTAFWFNRSTADRPRSWRDFPLRILTRLPGRPMDGGSHSSPATASSTWRPPTSAT
jgi:hypothetical protein